MNIEVSKEALHDAYLQAVTEISADVKGLLQAALDRETNDTAKSMLSSMLDNLRIAKEQDKAVCQSPGYPATWISFSPRFSIKAPPPMEMTLPGMDTVDSAQS